MTKPAFKLRLDGGIELLAPAAQPQSEAAARQLIQRHYGTVSAFCGRTGLPHWAVTTALSHPYQAARSAGWVMAARLYLGLKSEPTQRSLEQAALKFSRRSAA